MAHPAPKSRTTSVIVQSPSSRTITALTAKEIAGDRGIDDFLKWVQNFGSNNTGHFLNEGKAGDFAEYMRNHIVENMGGFVDKVSVAALAAWVHNEAKAYPGWFTSTEAAAHFGQQIINYVETDEFIGEQPHAGK